MRLAMLLLFASALGCGSPERGGGEPLRDAVVAEEPAQRTAREEAGEAVREPVWHGAAGVVEFPPPRGEGWGWKLIVFRKDGSIKFTSPVDDRYYVGDATEVRVYQSNPYQRLYTVTTTLRKQ